jgi:NAD(P)-dependent dehydrogenase (short-subunit alcohol dehydrogenase family)/acyl dehydratase
VGTFQIAQNDQDLFAAASHDRNPLHMSPDYAHRTTFGKPVVFGVLTALTAMRSLPERRDASLASVTLNFAELVLLGVNYSVRFEDSRGRVKMTVKDAGRRVLTASLEFRSTTRRSGSKPVTSGNEPVPAAVKREFEGLHPGVLVEGRYSPSEVPFQMLLDRGGLEEKGVQATEIATLLWASYLVGMELPGERALFARLKVAFEPSEGGGPIQYEAHVENVDERFDLVNIKARLAREGSPLAVVEIGAYVRRDTPQLSHEAISAVLPASSALRGKVALVVGGSRGLGAALVSALAQQGATVLLNYRSSHGEARALADALAGESGRVELVPGDATDKGHWARFRSEVMQRFGGLDILICNAAPPLRPMGLDPDSLDRLHAYVSDQLAMAGAPLVSFANALDDRSGSIVLISSIGVTQAPPGWHHYVVAKVAIEALAREIAAEYAGVRLMIARPPRLLTDMTNAPGVRVDVVRVEPIAGRIAEALVSSDWGARVRIEEFPGETPA